MSCCCPAFCCTRTSASTGQTKDDNLGIHLAESANFTKTMMCALTGHCVHQTCLQVNMCRAFLDRGCSMHKSIILAAVNPQALDATLPNTRIIQSMRSQ